MFFRLPYDSETKFEIGEVPEEARLWSVNTYMLANVIDMLQALDWHFITANSKRAPSPPKPFKRPAIKKEYPKPKGYWPGKTIIDKKGNS